MQAHRRALMLLTCAALAAMFGMPAAHAQKKTVTIGTAGIMGVYFPLGGALCRIVNATRKEHQLRCSVEPTEGSVSNIKGVLAGDFELGFAQSDSQYYAMKGEGPFKDKPQPKVRTLFSVYPEVFTLMTRRDANIKTFEDIKGKRISIGSPGSGTRATMDLVMNAYGIKRSDLKSAAELKFIELAPALCDSRSMRSSTSWGIPTRS